MFFVFFAIFKTVAHYDQNKPDNWKRTFKLPLHKNLPSLEKLSRSTLYQENLYLALLNSYGQKRFIECWSQVNVVNDRAALERDADLVPVTLRRHAGRRRSRVSHVLRAVNIFTEQRLLDDVLVKSFKILSETGNPETHLVKGATSYPQLSPPGIPTLLLKCLVNGLEQILQIKFQA